MHHRVLKTLFATTLARQLRCINCQCQPIYNTASVTIQVTSTRVFPCSYIESFRSYRTMSGNDDHIESDAGFVHRTRKNAVSEARERFVSMPVDEKRKLYKCKENYVKLVDVHAWPDYFKDFKLGEKSLNQEELKHSTNNDINLKLSIWRGDITTIEIDAITNAANGSLMGGGGVDGAIHAAAGSALRAECETLRGCDTGDAKITAGYKLPAKYIIHTVGPRGEHSEKLKSCYIRCLELMKENHLTSLAIPCISTGIYGYPNEAAAHVALNTVREFLEKDDYAEKVERIIFCLFLATDVRIYQNLMQVYFPIQTHDIATKKDEIDKESSTSDLPKEDSEEQTSQPHDLATKKDESTLSDLPKEDSEEQTSQSEPDLGHTK